jgi:WD40 repeat protein
MLALTLAIVMSTSPARAFPGILGMDFHGHTIATSYGSNIVDLWDARSGRRIKQLIVRHRRYRNGEQSFENYEWVRFSPDGRRLIAGNAVESAVGYSPIWNVRSGRLVSKLAVSHEPGALDPPMEPIFSPNGQYVLGTNSVGETAVWSANNGAMRFFVGKDEEHHGLGTCCPGPDPAGFSYASYGDLSVWGGHCRLNNAWQEQVKIDDPTGYPGSINFTSDRRSVIMTFIGTGSFGVAAYTLHGSFSNPDKITLSKAFFKVRGVECRDVTISRKNRSVIVGGAHGDLIEVSYITGKVLKRFTVPDHGLVSRLALNWDDNLLVVSTHNPNNSGTLTVWDPSTGRLLRSIGHVPPRPNTGDHTD